MSIKYRASPQAFTCPRCKAKVGQVCVALAHNGKLGGVRPHRERLELAAAKDRQTHLTKPT